MDCTPYCSGSGLLILPLVNSFHDGLRAVFNSGWQRIAHSFSRQWLSRRFSRRIAQRMTAYCSFFLWSTAFTTVCAPYCSADCSALLILPLVNGFHNGLRAVLLCGWQCIAHYSARQRLLRWFSHRIAPRMAAYCSFFHSSMAFTTACAPCCPADSAADRSFFLSSTAFTTVCAPYCSADGSGLLIPPLVDGFPDYSRAVLLSGWRRIAHSFSRQWLSQRFARRIAQRTAAHCSFFRSSTAFTTGRAPYCWADCIGLLIPPLVDSFHDGLLTLLLSDWHYYSFVGSLLSSACR